MITCSGRSPMNRGEENCGSQIKFTVAVGSVPDRTVLPDPDHRGSARCDLFILLPVRGESHMSQPLQMTYRAEPTARKFHASNKFFRGIRGPLGCLPGETEFLSPTGWRRMDGVTPGEELAVWDPRTKQIHFEQARPVQYDCQQFLRFRTPGTSLDMTLSPEHRILYDTAYDPGNVREITAAEAWDRNNRLKDGLAIRVPTAFSLREDARPGLGFTDDELRFFVAFSADGYIPKAGKKHTFCFRKPRKIERILFLFNRLGITPDIQVRKGRPMEVNFVFPGKIFTKELSALYNATERQLRVILDEIPYWDGFQNDEERRYFSSSKANADFVQYACAALGIRASLQRKKYSNKNWKDSFTVNWGYSTQTSWSTLRGTRKEETVPSVDGKMYCFQTSTGAFVVRQHDRIFITGNSGKTSSCVMEMYTRAMEQRPDQSGVRKTRFAVIRATFPELLSTTIKSFRDWIPESICPISRGVTITGHMTFALQDSTRVDSEFYFFALDVDDDVEKIKGAELTGAYVNEASEIKKAVVDMLTLRVGRYPSKRDGGCSWSGIIADTNSPPDRHWWYQLAEVQKPEGYLFLAQPPALLAVREKDKPVRYVPNDGTFPGIPKAENIDNLDLGFEYYLRAVPGKTEDWIRVMILNEYGSLLSGKAVFPEYSDTVHLAKEPLKVYGGLPLLLGLDFGLSPACVIAQQTPRGQLRVLRELVSEDMGVERFTRDVILPLLRQEEFAQCPIFAVGDPAGAQRAQTNEVTVFQTLALNGLPAEPAPTQDFPMRREAVAWFLTKLTDGEPGFLLDPRCKVLREGFTGQYRYRKMKVNESTDRYAETPEKNEYSHIHDSLQYLCCHLRSADVYGGNGDFRIGVPGRREVKIHSPLSMM